MTTADLIPADWVVAVHPYADAFPVLDDDLRELVESIRANGLRHPVVVTPSGLILDGRNRAAACAIVGITPETVVIPAARLRAVVVLLGAGEITPCAKRLLLRLADEYDPPPPALSPDCADGHKCHACSGDAWDLTGDRPAHCSCGCHDVTHSEDVA